MSGWSSRVVLWIGVGWVLGCGTLRKPPEPDRRLDIRMAGSMFESDLGYRFAALPDPGANVVRLDVRYPVGSTDDPPGKEGLAHLVEHLLFEVEIERSGAKTSIGAELGRVALSTNASTHEDYTQYQFVSAPGALDDLMRLEIERHTVGCAGLTPEIVAREREVVLNELRQRQGASGGELQRLIYEALYPAGHPYRAVSSIESVARLELADVCGFLVGPYRRGKVIVIASGAVDGPALQTAAGRHFGRAPKRAVTASRPVPRPVAPQPGTVRVRADVDETTLYVTWPLPAMGSRDYRMLEFAWPMIPSRLGAFGLRYGWGHSASVGVVGGAHAPMLAVSVTLASAGDLDEAISSAKKAAEFAFRVLHRGGDTRETPRWISQWRFRAELLLARWDSLAGRNDMFADFLQFETGDRFLASRIDELATATPADVRDLAERWLAPKKARFVLVEPSGTGTANRRRTYAGGAEAHGTAVDASSADRPLPLPAPGPALTTERYTLGNGLTVILWPHGTSPLVHGRLLIDSGAAHDPKGQEGVSTLVRADQLSFDHLVYSDRRLSTHVDELVATIAGELRWPGYELDDESKGVMRGRLKRQRAKERIAYARDYFVALYGEAHPYARVGLTEDSLDNISRDAVIGWARDHIVPKNAVLILAGKFDPSLVKKHVAYNVDQVSAGRDSEDRTTIATPRQQWIRGVAEKASPTVEIDVGFLGGEGVDRDHARRLLLAEILGSQLTKLRSKQALSYGFSASYEPRRAGGLLAITGEADASRAAEAATSIATILGEMRASPEAYRSAFVLAREKLLENLLVSATDASEIVSRLVHLARFDLPATHYDQLARSVARMTLAEFHPFLVSELAVEGQVFGAFGNADAVDAALAAAKNVQPIAKDSGIVDPFQ